VWPVAACEVNAAAAGSGGDAAAGSGGGSAAGLEVRRRRVLAAALLELIECLCFFFQRTYPSCYGLDMGRLGLSY
jgi:hypothetical protein